MGRGGGECHQTFSCFLCESLALRDYPSPALDETQRWIMRLKKDIWGGGGGQVIHKE